MHSSRMLTVSQHALLGMYLPGGVYLPRGRTCPGVGCVPAQGGVPEEVLPPVNRMTDRCKNITLPKTSFAGGKKLLLVHSQCRLRRKIYSNLC